MANTFSQIYIQFVFAVKGRSCLIPSQHKEELHRFITGVISKRKQKLLAIYCMPDHVHLFVNIQPNICISDLMRDVKAASSKFIKEKNWTKSTFAWQPGFGSFSYAHSQRSRVIDYINNQEKHHQIKSFHMEYIEMLDRFKVDFNEKYLFKFIE